MQQFHGTTIISVRDAHSVALGGDGQVSLGDTVMKGNAVKVRKLYQDKVLAGFAGSTADAFTLFEKFEAALEKYHGQLTRAAVELAKEWRSDRALRKLEAMLIVADTEATLLISGNGDVGELPWVFTHHLAWVVDEDRVGVARPYIVSEREQLPV